MSKRPKVADNTIAQNRRARHDYHIDETLEAGIMLEGWEVKSLREGRVQINEAHIIVRRAEAYLLNAHITPLQTASTHIDPNPTRTRKLLLHRREINKMLGWGEQKGYTIVPLRLYWKNNKVKVAIGLARGKKLFDKRADEKARDWQRQKQRLMRHKN